MTPRSALQPKPSGLEVERRSGRHAVEVSIPFYMAVDNRMLTGARLSLRQVTVRADRLLLPAGQIDVSLHVRLEGFNVRLPLRLAPATPGGEPSEWRFDILDMHPHTEEALTQLVRTSLSGWMPSASDLASGWDEETPRSRPATKGLGTGMHCAVLVAGLVLAAIGLAFAVQQAYFLHATVPLETAAVTAQRLDILSPEYGEVAEGSVTAGMTVQPGEPLIRVASDMLGAAIDLEQFAPFEAVPDERRSTGRLEALKRRLGALSFTSRCTCTVLWAASPGVSVAPGALLMSLVVSDPAEVRVEAWIPPRLAPEVHAGQKASVTLSGSAKTYAATVEGVTYATSPVARVGLGPRGDMATVTLKLDDADAGLVPGRPATGVIFK